MDQNTSRLRKRLTPKPARTPAEGTAASHNSRQSLLKTLRQHIEYGLLRGFLGGLRLLGLERASRWGGVLWQAIAPRTRRHQRALKHLALALPERSAQEHEAIARAMWNNLGRVAAEASMLDKIITDPARINVLTPDIIETVKQAGGKAVVASMHYGNWELGMWPFTSAGFSSLALYQEIKNPSVDALIHRLRAPVLPGGLYGKGHSTPRKLLQAVKAGNPLAILADLRDHRGVDIDFFSRPAPSTPFPALIARQTGALLIAGRVIRRDNVHFDVEGVVIDVPQTEDKNADILAATQNLQAQFETWIRETPEQWMWAHQRWGKGH